MYPFQITVTIHLVFKVSFSFSSWLIRKGTLRGLLRLGNHEFDYGAERAKDTRLVAAMIPLVNP